MSDKAAKIISAGLFALALSYLIMNVREVHPLSETAYLKLNHLTGNMYWCTSMLRLCVDTSKYEIEEEKSE